MLYDSTPLQSESLFKKQNIDTIYLSYGKRQLVGSNNHQINLIDK